MVVLAPSRSAQLLIAACTFVACASGPKLDRAVTVTAGQRTTVRLLQVNGTLALSLRNASAQESSAVYTPISGDIDPGCKIVDDVNLQTLLDLFATKQMFAGSLREVPAGSRDALIVEQGDRRWVWAVSSDKQARIAAQRAGDRGEMTFHEARAEFLSLYNSAMAFHGAANRPNLKAEAERASRSSAASRDSMTRLPKEPR